jgi:hypothetical protein
VHRVGAKDQTLRARTLESLGVPGQQRCCVVPAVLALEDLDGCEVDAVHDAVGGVQAAEPVADRFVEQAVVLGRRLPAHAAQESDALHRRRLYQQAVQAAGSAERRGISRTYGVVKL